MSKHLFSSLYSWVQLYLYFCIPWIRFKHVASDVIFFCALNIKMRFCFRKREERPNEKSVQPQILVDDLRWTKISDSWDYISHRFPQYLRRLHLQRKFCLFFVYNINQNSMKVFSIELQKPVKFILQKRLVGRKVDDGAISAYKARVNCNNLSGIYQHFNWLDYIFSEAFAKKLLGNM